MSILIHASLVRVYLIFLDLIIARSFSQPTQLKQTYFKLLQAFEQLQSANNNTASSPADENILIECTASNE